MFYFIRHAQSRYNQKRRELKAKIGPEYGKSLEYLEIQFGKDLIDAQLSQIGIKEAQQCKETMKNIQVDTVVVSPLRRTLETCDIVFKGHKSNPKIIVDPRLREYMQNVCDIGCKLSESMEKFSDFDYSLIEDPHAWYIHHMFEEEHKQTIKKKLEQGVQNRRVLASDLALQYIKQLKQRQASDNEGRIKDEFREKMKKQRIYLKEKYGGADRRVVVISHFENMVTYLDHPFKNCEIYPISSEQL